MDSNRERLTKTAKKFILNYQAILRIALLVVVDIGLIWFTTQLIINGFYDVAIVLIIIVIFNTYVFLAPKAYPLRWMAIGLSALLVVCDLSHHLHILCGIHQLWGWPPADQSSSHEQIQRELLFARRRPSF
jgi:hypothetical protein